MGGSICQRFVVFNQSRRHIQIICIDRIKQVFFGFVLTQGKELKADKPFEEFTPEGFEEEQKTLEQIEKQTIVRFSAGLKKVDAMLNHPKGLEVMPLSSLEDVWLGRL